MAQTGTGVAAFGKEINDWLNSVGDDVLVFSKDEDAIQSLINKWVGIWQTSLETAKRPNSKGVGHIASGNLYSSLAGNKKLNTGWFFKSLGKTMTIELVLPDYWSATDKGRKPSSGNGSGALRKALEGAGGWIAQRKIVPSGGMKINGRQYTSIQANKMLSFAIAKKIHEKGFEGSNWFSKDLEKFKGELAKAVEEQFGKGTQLNLKIFDLKK